MGEVEKLIYKHPREKEFINVPTKELEERLEHLHKKIRQLEFDLEPLREEGAAIACVIAKRAYRAVPVQKIKKGTTKKSVEKELDKWLKKLTPQQMKALEKRVNEMIK